MTTRCFLVATERSVRPLFVKRLVSSHPDITGRYHRHSFSNGEFVVILDAGFDTPTEVLLILAAWGDPANVFLEAGLLLDAISREDNVTRVTLIVPYLPFSRSNRINEPRIALGAKVFADLLCTLPVARLILFNLHAPELIGFFSKRVSAYDVLPLFVEHADRAELRFDYVVSPDCGRYDECVTLAARIGATPDFFVKLRGDHTERSQVATVHKSHVAGKAILLFDDELVTGKTMENAVWELIHAGASLIYVAIIYTFGEASVVAKILGLPNVHGYITTDLSGEASVDEHDERITLLSCQGLVSGVFTRRIGPQDEDGCCK